MRRRLAALAVLALLGACGKSEEGGSNGAPEAPMTQTANARPAEFAQCAICHNDAAGAPNKMGPNLFGIVGTKAGEHAAGFSYSPAMKSSGLLWDRATLDRYLEYPAKLVPGTRMAFAGQKDPAKRKAIIDYLETLR